MLIDEPRARSQSNQATASACAVNNIHLVKGAIGKEGATVFQFNGQPTAQVRLPLSLDVKKESSTAWPVLTQLLPSLQNNRECGCNGEFPGFRVRPRPLDPRKPDSL